MGKNQRIGGSEAPSGADRRTSDKVAAVEELRGSKKLSDHQFAAQVGCRRTQLEVLSVGINRELGNNR